MNVEGRVHHQGDNAGLSEAGRWQAQRLAQRYQQYGVQVLLSSPELRAMETARAIAVSVLPEPVGARSSASWQMR